MKLFVTGGTGFIGSHFLSAANSNGHHVIAQRRSPESHPRIDVEGTITWVTKPLRDVSIADLAGTDCVVHLAASGVAEAASWPELFQDNVLDPVQLWRTAAEAEVKSFIICGSCFEYGRSGERYDFIPVEAPLEPITPYAASKASASLAAITFATEYKVAVTVCRPFHVFGQGEIQTRLWPSLKLAAESGADIDLTEGEQIRDFVPVELVAEKILQLCESNPATPGQVKFKNIGTGQPQSIKKFCQEWWTHWGASGRLLFGRVPYRKNEIMRYVPSLDE